jgi:hypothetical protein
VRDCEFEIVALEHALVICKMSVDNVPDVFDLLLNDSCVQEEHI